MPLRDASDLAMLLPSSAIASQVWRCESDKSSLIGSHIEEEKTDKNENLQRRTTLL
jgi:hypothetical protein